MDKIHIKRKHKEVLALKNINIELKNQTGVSVNNSHLSRYNSSANNRGTHCSKTKHPIKIYLWYEKFKTTEDLGMRKPNTQKKIGFRIIS